MNGVLVVIVVVDVLLVVVVVTAGGGQSWWLMVVMVVVAGGGGGGGVVVWWLVNGSGSDDFQSQTHKQNDAHPSNQIRWPWACSFPITIWWTNQCTSKPPNPLALDLFISKQDLCFWGPCLGSDHYISPFMNKTIRIQASQAPGLDLAISNQKFMKKAMQIYAFKSTSPGSTHFLSHSINKPIQIEASKPTGPGPAHFQSQVHEQKNTGRSLEIHWPWTCSKP